MAWKLVFADELSGIARTNLGDGAESAADPCLVMLAS